MTSLTEHQKNFQQCFNDINEKIRAGLLLERQKIIGFAASEGAANLLEYFFHKKNLVSPGFKVNHRYFASEPRARRYLDFDFPKKEELISLMVKQDEFRNLLCYGKEKEIKLVQEAIDNLMNIKTLIETELGEKL